MSVEEALREHGYKPQELEKLFAIARKDLPSFRKVCLEIDEDEEKEPAPFHYKWSDILLRGKTNYAIEAFRESAKTSYVIRAFPLYSMTFPHKNRSYIVLVKNNSTLASSKLKEIEREYLGNPLLSARLVKIVEQSKDCFHIRLLDDNNIEVEFRMEAYGKGSSIRGIMYKNKRPDIVILDDIQDLEDVRSETVVENDWDWFLSDVYFLGKKTRIFMIGNNLGDKCIIERVLANPKAYNFKGIRIPVIDINGNPTWPDNTDIDQILTEKERFDSMGKLSIWMREKMCIAVADADRVIRENDFRYYHPSLRKELVASCNIFTVMDLATGKKERNDFTAIVTVAVNENNHWFVIDIDYGRWQAPEIIDYLVAIVRAYRPMQVGIEKGALKNIIEPFLHKVMASTNTFFNLSPINCKRSKEERVELALAPRFAAHTIYFPEEAEWLPELKSELTSLTRSEGFKSLHDDLADALAGIEQIAYAPMISIEPQYNTPPSIQVKRGLMIC